MKRFVLELDVPEEWVRLGGEPASLINTALANAKRDLEAAHASNGYPAAFTLPLVISGLSWGTLSYGEANDLESEWGTANFAADRFGLSRPWVQRLASQNRIRSRTHNGTTLVYLPSVAAYMATPRKPGRKVKAA